MKKIYTLMASCLVASSMYAQLPAFPGAEGYGALATGGRESRTIVHVTNLNASGPGSLSAALSGSNRIVVFDVGGIIHLSPSEMVAIDKHDNITVLGQTAPGQGITIYGNRVLIRNCNNVIFRYIRMRGSINMAKDGETLTMDNANNVILDHCSISWGRWDNVHIKDANNITWSNCIITEGIDPQRFGAITDGTRNWTITHCLWTNHKSRNPKMKCWAQMINSVVYNGSNGVVGGHSSADNYQDLINNYYIAGPSGNSSYSQWTATDHLYQSGNIMDDNKDGILNGRDYFNAEATNMDKPYHSPQIPVTVESAADAFESVLADAGCSRVRDSHDQRIIDQVKSLGKEGALIDNESQVGGIGTLNPGTPIVDTDGDGMPDDWEKAHGLDPQNAADAVEESAEGYLNIEKYANSLAVNTHALATPINLKAVFASNDPTIVMLTFKNIEERAVGVLVESSLDGETFTQVDSVAASKGSCILHNIDPTKPLYLRVRATDGQQRSFYTPVICLNQPVGYDAGGGTKAGTKEFQPEEDKFYRIILYASKYFNSGTNYTGAPQYLTTKNHLLSVSTKFKANDPALVWNIVRDSSDPNQYFIQNVATGESLAPTANGDGAVYVAKDLSALYEINYNGDEKATQSGISDAISFYRINTRENKGYQLRPQTADKWLWGNGPIVRADMAYTFQAVDKSLIDLSTTAIRTVSMPVTKSDDNWYNLQGQKVLYPTHGIYIHQGKKVIR